MQLCLDLREEAPSTFILEPPSIMLHLWTELWGEKTLLTHISVIEEKPGQYSGSYPFFRGCVTQIAWIGGVGDS